MTCIAGLVHRGEVWMGADSAGVGGWTLTVRRDPKVFAVGEFLIGYTSSFRMGQLLHYRFTAPEHPRGDSTERYLSTAFIDAVRECFGKYGYREKDKERESGGTFLVGYRGVLAEVNDDFQVALARDPFAAVGSGDRPALGALWTLHRLRTQVSPREKLRLALRAAERLSAGVRGPFTILRLGDIRREKP